MNIEAIRLHAQNKGDRKLLKLIEGAYTDREGVIDDVLDIMSQFKCEPDEDSCGHSFFTARINEDSFFIAKNKLQALKTAKPSPAKSASSEQGEKIKRRIKRWTDSATSYFRLFKDNREGDQLMAQRCLTRAEVYSECAEWLTLLLDETEPTPPQQQNPTTGEGRE